MILVGNSRGGAKNLALHLMKEENEHVEVFEISGFISQSLPGALNEAYALSRGTRCDNFLYSVSFNPPPDAEVSRDVFVKAIDRVGKELGLNGQPRAIVFHEKEGPGGVRRHAHAVWSRIDPKTMKAVHLSFDRQRLNSISRGLFIEHNWRLPDGYLDGKNRNPRNYTLAEWQQAKRVGKDPRQTKADIQNAWAISDSKVAFEHALEERGYVLARGNRRSFVAVDVHGEVYSIPRIVGVKTKLVRERLGDEQKLSDIAKAQERYGSDMLGVLKKFRHELSRQSATQLKEYEARRRTMVDRHRIERLALEKAQERRWHKESLTRQARFQTGLKGLWDRVRGEYRRTQRLNEGEAREAKARDLSEVDGLTFRHLEQRRSLGIYKLQLREEYTRQRRELEQDRDIFMAMRKGISHSEPEP